jgi:hypothetical protein
VYVYDNNFPGESNRYLVIDTVAEAWAYNMGTAVNPTIWSGDSTTDTLAALPTPLSLLALSPGTLDTAMASSEPTLSCPWCAPTLQQTSTATNQIWQEGDGSLLISDDQGRQIGYVGTTFVNEIPDARISVPYTGISAAAPIYTVPVGQQTITLNGANTPVGALRFGGDRAIGVLNTAIPAGSADTVTIAGDGSSLTYTASANRAADLVVAGDVVDFTISDIGIETGKSADLALDTSAGTFEVATTNASNTTYDLEIVRQTSNGPQRFIARDVVIGSNATHTIKYASWDGGSQITVEVDIDRNGTVDQTIILNNQTYFVALPHVLIEPDGGVSPTP